MQISSLSAANVQTVWAGRNAACWHLLLAAGFCHMMVENKKQGEEESSRSNFDFSRVNNDRVAGRSHFHKVLRGMCLSTQTRERRVHIVFT